MPLFDKPRLLLAGFRLNEIDVFHASRDVTIAAAFVISDHRSALTESRFPTFRYFDVVRCRFNPDIPPAPTALRSRLLNASLPVFRRHQSRLAFAEEKTQSGWNDLDNRFHLAADFYTDLIERHRIDSVIFPNFPHEGSLVILHDLARHLGLRIVIAHQSMFPAQMWLMQDMDDFGAFRTVPGAGATVSLPAQPERPFYMHQTPRWRTALRHRAVLLREAAKLAINTMLLGPVLRPASTLRNTTRFKDARTALRLDTRPTAHFVTDPDLTADFVYFPLHLQPELTTDTLGGQYGDQLLAIEELAEALPTGMCIYVKENPHQTAYMREATFHIRMNRLPNVRFVDPALPSFDMIRQSRFVATISGTAGWEALLLGKATVHFGAAWYASLPGTFRWIGPKTVAQATAFMPDRSALERAFGDLSRKLYPGVIDQDYAALLPGYDRDEHGRLQYIRSFQ